MKRILGVCILLVLSVVIVSGCSTPQRRQPVVMQVQYIKATIIEGQTTKTDVLKVLGSPDNFSSAGIDTLTYNYMERSPLVGAKIRYVQKDGTEFGVILRNGGDKWYVLFMFEDNGVLMSANFM